jgi:hypothetical protein
VLAALLTLTLAAPGFGVRLDLGATVPVSAAQSASFTPGPGGSISGELGLLPFLDAEVQLAALVLPRTAASPSPGSGTLLSLGAGLRLHRMISDSLMVPWGDVVLSYGASGGSPLLLTASTGLSFKPRPASGFLVGAFARLQYGFALGAREPGSVGFDSTLVSFGLSLEYFAAPADSGGDGGPDQAIKR